MFVAEGDVFGLGLVEADESAAAELARLRGVMQRFEKPREGSSLHLESVEGKCVAHSFTVDAARRLFIKTEVPLCSFINNSKPLSYVFCTVIGVSLLVR